MHWLARLYDDERIVRGICSTGVEEAVAIGAGAAASAGTAAAAGGAAAVGTTAAVGATAAGISAATYASIAATLLSTGLSIYGAVSSASAQADAARYNAQVGRNQAATAQQSADVQAAQIRDRNTRLLGANRAAIGASGVTTEGSPLLVLIDNAQQGELNARLAEYSGSRAAAGFNAQSELLRYQAGQFTTAGNIQAGATLLSGAASTARLYGASTPSSVPGGYNAINNPYSGPSF